VVIFVRMHQSSTMTGLIARLTGRALADPRVAIDLIALAWAFRRRGWWRRPPFLPLADQEYLEWRLHTAYGEERQVPPVEDVLRFARWRRRILHD
jgi:hypothetical protein